MNAILGVPLENVAALIVGAVIAGVSIRANRGRIRKRIVGLRGRNRIALRWVEPVVWVTVPGTALRGVVRGFVPLILAGHRPRRPRVTGHGIVGDARGRQS